MKTINVIGCALEMTRWSDTPDAIAFRINGQADLGRVGQDGTPVLDLVQCRLDGPPWAIERATPVEARKGQIGRWLGTCPRTIRLEGTDLEVVHEGQTSDGRPTYAVVGVENIRAPRNTVAVVEFDASLLAPPADAPADAESAPPAARRRR